MQRTVVTLVDDLTDEVVPKGSGETISFALDGYAYEIDLSDENVAALRAALEPYANVARQVGGPRRRRRLQSVPNLPAETPVVEASPAVEAPTVSSTVDPPAIEIVHEPPTPVEVPVVEPVAEPEPEPAEPEPVAPAAPEPDAGEPEARGVEYAPGAFLPEPDEDGVYHCDAPDCAWPGSALVRNYKGHRRLSHGIGGASAAELSRRARAVMATIEAGDLEDALAAEATASVEIDEDPAAVVETRVAKSKGRGRGKLSRRPVVENRTRGPVQAASYVAPPIGVAAEVEKIEWTFPCTETNADGSACELGSNFPQGLAAHRRLAHGIGKAGRKAEPVVAEEVDVLTADMPGGETAEEIDAREAVQPSPETVAPVVLRGRCTWVDENGKRCTTRVGEPGERCSEHDIRFASEPVVDLDADAWEPVVVVHAGSSTAPDAEIERVVDPDDVEWTVVPTLERHVVRVREQYAKGVPIDVIPIPHENVLALEGLDFEIVESALRHPDSVDIAPETFGKGYPVLRFRRGDAIVVLGFRDAQPSIIAAYHGHLLGNDYHRARAGRTGGGGKKKEQGMPRNASTLVRRLVGMGAVVDWDLLDYDRKTAGVSYLGSELGKVSVGPNVPRETVETDWQRMTRKIEAIAQRRVAEAG